MRLLMCEDNTILVIEDHRDTSEMLKAFLVSRGFYVDTVRTAGETLELLDRRCDAGKDCYALCLIDIDLPDVRGTTLGGWIRDRYPEVGLLYGTGYTTVAGEAPPTFVVKAHEQGAKILIKPYDFPLLEAEVREAIRLASFEGEEKRRKWKPDNGLRRRATDLPAIVPPELREHIEKVAEARAASGELRAPGK